MMSTTASKPAPSASWIAKSSIVSPPGPSGSSCFGPPNRLPEPAARPTSVMGASGIRCSVVAICASGLAHHEAFYGMPLNDRLEGLDDPTRRVGAHLRGQRLVVRAAELQVVPLGVSCVRRVDAEDEHGA